MWACGLALGAPQARKGERAGRLRPAPAFRARWPLRLRLGGRLLGSPSQRGGVPGPLPAFLLRARTHFVPPRVNGRVLALALFIGQFNGLWPLERLKGPRNSLVAVVTWRLPPFGSRRLICVLWGIAEKRGA